MKLKAIIKKTLKFNPNDKSNSMGDYRVWLDFGEQYSKEALMLFALQGGEQIMDVEIKPENEK